MILNGNKENLNGIQNKSGVKSVLAIEFVKWRRIRFAIECHFLNHKFGSIRYRKKVSFIFTEISRFKIERNSLDDDFLGLTF